MNMDTDELQLHLQQTPSQYNSSVKRPRRSLQSTTPLSSVSESASPSPRLSGQASLTPEVINHINALKHLDDQQIFHLLEAARRQDRQSISTLGSRSSFLSVPSSRVTSVLSDPRSSVASTDTTFSNWSAGSRLSTASRFSTASRLSTGSFTSQGTSNPPVKNFACTFCDKPLKSKPYWKSHEEEFHEQRLTWRCPDCEQIFNAGKRFREHHHKLHGCEACKQPKLDGQPTSRKASPCVKKYEKVMFYKDAWGCGFCASLLRSWDERCEHIANHFEDKRSKWDFSNVILGLLKQPDVAPAWRSLLIQKHGDEENWPRLSWEQKASNRLRNKMELAWDSRGFDVEKLVQETYELAIIDTQDPQDIDSQENQEMQDTKPDPLSFVDEPSTTDHPDNSMSMSMDLDPIEAPQSLPPPPPPPPAPPAPPQPEWAVSNGMSQSTITTDDGLNTFSFATDFTQPMPQNFQQTTWNNNDGFLPSNDIMTFQQPGAYMDYIGKPVTSTPQYANSIPFSRPTSSASSYLGHSASTSSRRWVPKIVNIPSQRSDPSQDQPPPPPPKDDRRFSKIMMRRRPSNISNHSVVHQWYDENSWG